MVNLDSTKVNRYAFINRLREEVKGSSADRVFEIKIEDLKKELERKIGLRNIEMSKEIGELLSVLEGGKRGKKDRTMLMEVKGSKSSIPSSIIKKRREEDYEKDNDDDVNVNDVV